MDSKGGTNSKRVLSWIAAVILIAAGAVAIGWFAGAALIDFWAPTSADYPTEEDNAESLAEGDNPDTAAEDGAVIGPNGQDEVVPESQSNEVSNAETDTADSGTSPFASPPWANNLVIKPLDEQTGATDESSAGSAEIVVTVDEPAADEAAVDNTPQADQAAEAVQQPSAPVSSSSTAAQQPSTTSLYKVRVGPYATKEEAAAASARLTELQYPTIVVSSGPFYVQIGAFTVRANAENLLKKVQASGFAAVIVN